MSQFRNLFVEFSGDPSNDKELYKRYCSSEKFEPLSLSDEVIHFVEIAALEAAQKEIEQLTAALKVAEVLISKIKISDENQERLHKVDQETLVMLVKHSTLCAEDALDKIQKIKKGLG